MPKRVTLRFNDEDLWIYELVEDLVSRKKDFGISTSISKEIIAKLRQEFVTIAEQRELDTKLLSEKWDNADTGE